MHVCERVHASVHVCPYMCLSMFVYVCVFVMFVHINYSMYVIAILRDNMFMREAVQMAKECSQIWWVVLFFSCIHLCCNAIGACIVYISMLLSHKVYKP